MRRIIALARDWSESRTAFGKKIGDHPLHQQTMFELEAAYRGNLAFVLHVSEIMGYNDLPDCSEPNKLYLRFLTPLVKLFTAKECMRVVSEGLECFGGLGYMENSGIPVILRDA